jgi:hypothetical protein
MKRILSMFRSASRATPKEPERPSRGYRMPKTRTCECCGGSHECRESFREMVERCARERDGSPIIC